MVDVKIKKLDDSAVVPKYAHDGDAAFDLVSIEENTLSSGKKVLVATGIAMAIPQGYFGNIRDRSGLAAKHGIHTLAGVVDSGYRGEVKVVLMNLGEETFTIEKGMRIAQMLIQPVAQANLETVENLDDTSRSDGGFGSTGHK